MFHLDLQILIRIELQVIIEPLLVVSVAAFHFTVMPRRSRANCFVDDMKLTAKSIQRMNAICLLGVCKLSTVVRLNHLRRITKVNDRTLHKIYRAEAAVLFVGIDEAFSVGLVYW